MSTRYPFMLVVCLLCGALGCSRARFGSAGLASLDGGAPSNTAGGGSTAGRGAPALKGDFTGIGGAPGLGLGGQPGLDFGGAGGAGGFGFAGFGTNGSGGIGAAGSGASGIGAAGAGMAGLSGSSGSGSPPSCVYDPASYRCVYSDGSACNQIFNSLCCALSDNRCCDSNGRCSDPLPPPSPWAPPVASGDVGAAGWKDSSDPLCVGSGSYASAMSLWSDARGLFVAVTDAAPATQPGDPNCPRCDLQTQLLLNDGKSWAPVAGSPFPGQQNVKGLDPRTLILYGDPQLPNTTATCGLSLLANGMRSCQQVDHVADVAVIGGTLAYATVQADLVRYDGNQWGPVTAIMPARHDLGGLFADPTVVMATTQSAGEIYTLKSDVWTLEDTRTLDTFSAIWGFSPTDVWVGTHQDSVYHYDGSAWNKVAWEGSGCTPSTIVRMWGADGTLYFASSNTLARWNGTAVSVIAQWPCNDPISGPMIAGLWGNSATEVFIAIIDSRDTRQPCGSEYLLYYDGSKFHRM